jgi:hypothetical protein
MAQIPSTIPSQPPTSAPSGWAAPLRVRRAVRLASVLGTAALAGAAVTAHLTGAALACSGGLVIKWGA